MTTYLVIKDYSDLLDETLTKYKLTDKPAQIYNCDESGMPPEFKLLKIIAGKGPKRYDSVLLEIKILPENITIGGIACPAALAHASIVICFKFVIKGRGASYA